MYDQNNQRGGFVQNGPAWIASITAVLALVVLVVVIAVTRSGASDEAAPTGSGGSGPATSGVTPATDPVSPSASPSSSPVEPAVFWKGPLHFPNSYGADDSFSFDVSPPRYVDGHSVLLSVGDGHFEADEGILVAEWTSDGVPTWSECADLVTSSGSDITGGLSDGSVVCGRTIEGRIFRIEANHFDGYALFSTVTVWAA